MTRRLQEIIDAAEAAGEEIKAEARAQAAAEAAEYVEERRRAADALVEERLDAVAEATGPLGARLAELRRQAIAITEEVDRSLAAIRELTYTAPARVQPSAAPVSPEPIERPPKGQPAEDSRPARERAPAPVFAYPGRSASESTPAGVPESPPEMEEALLRATQMAVAGSDRLEIEQVLRSEFSIEDPGEIVSEILGPDPA